MDKIKTAAKQIAREVEHHEMTLEQLVNIIEPRLIALLKPYVEAVKLARVVRDNTIREPRWGDSDYYRVSLANMNAMGNALKALEGGDDAL